MSRASKKSVVDRMRVTWVLAALVASMTIGTVVLGVLEPRKIFASEKTTYLAATYHSDSSAKITRTSIPIETNLWQSVVIHTLRNASPDDLTIRCLNSGKENPAIAHFAISPDAKILISRTWVNQEPAEKYPGRILIGLQLADGRSDATLAQAQAIVTLIHNLQAVCDIPRSKVRLHSQFSGKTCSDPLYRYNWRDALLQ